MKAQRKTANDYRKEAKDIRESMKSLEAHVSSRLLELVKIHPDAIVIYSLSDQIKAKSLTKSWVDDMDINSRIMMIERIEEWSATQQNVKQEKLKI